MIVDPPAKTYLIAHSFLFSTYKTTNSKFSDDGPPNEVAPVPQTKTGSRSLKVVLESASLIAFVNLFEGKPDFSLNNAKSLLFVLKSQDGCKTILSTFEILPPEFAKLDPDRI